MVQNADGTRCVIGGTHKIFTEIESKYYINTRTFISDQHKSFKAGYHVNPDASLLHCKVEKDCCNDFLSNTHEILEPSNEQMKQEQLRSSLLARNLNFFEEAENAGSEISYRCKSVETVKFANSTSRLKLSASRKNVSKKLLISHFLLISRKE